MEKQQAVVVGGGIAGLAAATYLARGGLEVVLCERGGQLGGRARTMDYNGFKFNLGPHALFAGASGAHVLRELGVAWTGKKPSARTAHLWANGELFALMPFRHNSYLDLSGNLELLRHVRGLRSKAERSSELTFEEWLTKHVERPRVRALLSTLARVATYGADGTNASAAVMLRQLMDGFGATYLDGGWQTIVDGLRQAAVEAGVHFRIGCSVVDVEHDPQVRGVRLRDGSFLPASVIVMAIDPKAACSIVDRGAHPELRRAAERARPLRLATLDVALDELPNPRVTAAFAVEEPLYFSVHSKAARLAPSGGVVLHVAKYVNDGCSDPKAVRRELEEFLERLQPGWRDWIHKQRYLPAIEVAQDTLPAPSHRRIEPVVSGIEGLYVVGDWVGDEGLLADAALASARAAATHALLICQTAQEAQAAQETQDDQDTKDAA